MSDGEGLGPSCFHFQMNWLRGPRWWEGLSGRGRWEGRSLTQSIFAAPFALCIMAFITHLRVSQSEISFLSSAICFFRPGRGGGGGSVSGGGGGGVACVGAPGGINGSAERADRSRSDNSLLVDVTV